MPVPLPSIAQQQEIVSHQASFRLAVEQAETVVTRLVALKLALQQSLLSGRLRVKV